MLESTLRTSYIVFRFSCSRFYYFCLPSHSVSDKLHFRVAYVHRMWCAVRTGVCEKINNRLHTISRSDDDSHMKHFDLLHSSSSPLGSVIQYETRLRANGRKMRIICVNVRLDCSCIPGGKTTFHFYLLELPLIPLLSLPDSLISRQSN